MNEVISVQSASGTPDIPRVRAGGLCLTRSQELLSEARKLVPGVTHSLMKRPEMFALGAFPVFLAGGQGALVRDVDGNEYVDYISGLGANTLGHNHPALLSALRVGLEGGLLHSLPTEIELEAARTLLAVTPGAEMVRFFKTGADATSAAVRLARHLTGKEKVVTVGYNGWHDHFMFDTPGVPAALRELTVRMPLSAPEHETALCNLIEERSGELAALLLSLPYNRVVSGEFLHALRELCRRRGVLFVLDEVVTGFRLALGGAQEFYDLRADYVCLSKGIAAGMPLSAVVGPTAQLSRLGELQVSTTFGGELLSLAVCKAALDVYRGGEYVPQLARLGRRLREGVNRGAERCGSALRVVGYDAIPFFLYSHDLAEQARFMERYLGAMARRGVLLRRDVNFISAAHTEAQIDFTVRASDEALRQ
ncbi:MAG TPA: aminotransferase class III-fold pyridoxal phosphate-dependent enzyme, partial [Polyangiaceae bacterium]|nr:aminotransferase class III-fold pyridoxal phosphate-dependent enzyme [Polyangiaceae bacterium]